MPIQHPAIQVATTPESIARCFNVMRQLRPMLTSAEDMVARVQAQQAEGFQLAFREDQGEVVTAAGYRIQHMLVSGLTMYVDDLITGEQYRSQGHGKVMLDWLIAHARERNCQTFSLDSGTHRKDAHAFYLRERLRISGFHFELPLKA
jgi:GNAT superfamily N-acetyltransferase